MDKELCFNIENDSLYLEQVLVDYSDIPIYFLCKGNKEYYLALCIDLDNYNYIVVKVSFFDVYDLLHGNVSMRDAITKHREYWMIISDDDMTLDIVSKNCVYNIDESILPEKGARFKVLTKEIETYVKRIDEELMLHKLAVPLSKLEITEIAQISNNVDLIDYKFKVTTSSFSAYYEEMDSIGELNYGSQNMETHFELNVNNILAA